MGMKGFIQVNCLDGSTMSLGLDPIKQSLNFTYKVASLVKIPLRKNLETS
jgi:hypothetical protein